MIRTGKIVLAGMVFIVVMFILLDLLFPLRLQVSYSQVVHAQNGIILHASLSRDEKWRMEAGWSEIPEAMVDAFIFKEDRHFYYHPGVDPMALGRALFNNVIGRRKTSGASTITMQVARLLYPAPRTYGNKVTEMFRAFQLEMRFSKKEILLVYLNLIPYGGNIEGVKAAAWLYYGRNPGLLSLAQLVTLTIIPNRPSSLKPGKNNLLLMQERNRWLKRMDAAFVFPSDEVASALSEPLQMQRRTAPKRAPQFARNMMRQLPSEYSIRSSLNPAMQDKAEQLTYQYIQRIKPLNIHNAAVLVVENASRKIRAYVGSADFSDAAHAGEVDGVTAVRSPGSTLKPLVYGLAMDKGLITPGSIILDVPVNFAGYKPENFNSTFNGKVTAEKALAFSLNVPAVKLLNEIGVDAFSDKLKQAGFQAVSKNRSTMGLSMVLGGCGVSLYELAGLFASLANEGLYRPLKFLETDTSGLSSRILSESASYMISGILTMPVRPDLPNQLESSMHVPKVAWKTGTSYGRRDAWSIGYNKNLTIAVWVGNFDGRGVPELTGSDIATPLLFRLFNSLDYNSSNNWFLPPANLDFRLVCTETGLPPGDDCPDQISDYYIPGVSPYQKCMHNREFFVSADGTFTYCTRCLPPAGYRKKKYRMEAPALLAWYRSEHIDFTGPPPHNPSCTRVLQEGPPIITSPVNEKEYLLQKGQEEEMELKCQVSSDVKEVYWYINDRFYKKAGPAEPVFFKPLTGGYTKISCSDDQGRNKDCRIRIIYF